MKKICVITTVHSAFDVRIFHKEAKSLAAAGYRVSLIAPHSKNEVVENIEIIAMPIAKNRQSRFLFSGARAFKLALEQKADVYHFHDPEFLPWALLLKKKTNAKVIYDSHEDVPKQILSKEWIPRILRFPMSAFFNFFEKKITRKFDAVIAVTPAVAEKFFVPQKIYLANYPRLEYFNLLQNYPKRRDNPKTFTIIYAGGLTRIRGVKEIIEAYRLLLLDYRIRFKLAGGFSEKEFENEIKKNAIWKKIDYLGFLPLNAVYQHFATVDAGLICLLPEPNYIDSSPNKMFEYMAAGLPVVASDFPAWKKIIETNNCGLCVDPKNPQAIAEAIGYLFQHPDKAKKMGKNGRGAVEQKYSWENESKKLIYLYEKINKI